MGRGLRWEDLGGLPGAFDSGPEAQNTILKGLFILGVYSFGPNSKDNSKHASGVQKHVAIGNLSLIW